MKKIWTLILLVTPFMSQAQPPEGQDWWACQSVQAAGLVWEGGNWVATGFEVSGRFLLVADGEGLTQHSVSRAMDVLPAALHSTAVQLVCQVRCCSRGF